MFNPQMNVHYQRPQFELGDRQFVSKLTWSINTNQPQPNADQSDYVANYGIDVNMGGKQTIE